MKDWYDVYVGHNSNIKTYTIWQPLDNNPDGAMIEIKDRRDGQWRSDLFFENNKWHNYLIEITEDGVEGITQSYHTQNQNHALKVYQDIVNKGDYKWGKKYLDKLVIKAKKKHESLMRERWLNLTGKGGK